MYVHLARATVTDVRSDLSEAFGVEDFPGGSLLVDNVGEQAVSLVLSGDTDPDHRFEIAAGRNLTIEVRTLAGLELVCGTGLTTTAQLVLTVKP